MLKIFELEFDDALKLFDEILVRNVITWNILISRLVGCGRSFAHLGFCYFTKMVLKMFVPDSTTYTGLLRLYIEQNDVENGRQLHSLIVKLGWCKDCFVGSALVDLYAKFGLVKVARHIFDFVLDRDVVMWNVMVSCYAFNGLGRKALGVLNLMSWNGVKGDDFTFTSLLKSSAISGSCALGRQIHGLVIRKGFDLDVVMASAFIDMYTKNENIGVSSANTKKYSLRSMYSKRWIQRRYLEVIQQVWDC